MPLSVSDATLRSARQQVPRALPRRAWRACRQAPVQVIHCRDIRPGCLDPLEQLALAVPFAGDPGIDLVEPPATFRAERGDGSAEQWTNLRGAGHQLTGPAGPSAWPGRVDGGGSWPSP
jgi:hypothetical protein